MSYAFHLKEISFNEFHPIIEPELKTGNLQPSDIVIAYNKNDKDARGIYIVSTQNILSEGFNAKILNQEEFNALCFSVNQTKGFDIWGDITLFGGRRITPPMTK